MEGIGPVAGLPWPYRKFSMKKGTSMLWAMARRTRTSASSRRRWLNSSVLLKALASSPLLDTVKRGSFHSGTPL